MKPPSGTNPPSNDSEWLQAHMRHVLPAFAGTEPRTAAHSVSQTWHLPVGGCQVSTTTEDTSDRTSRFMSRLTLGMLKALVAEFGASLSIEADTTETTRFKYTSLADYQRRSR